MKTTLKIGTLTAVALSVAACSSSPDKQTTHQPTPTVKPATPVAPIPANNSQSEAQAELNKEKINELKEYALSKGLSQDEAERFALNNINTSVSTASANLDKIILDKTFVGKAITIPSVNGEKITYNIAAYNSSDTQSGKSVITRAKEDGKPGVYWSSRENKVTNRSLGYVVNKIETNGFGYIDGKETAQQIQGVDRVYSQPYSVVYGTTFEKVVVDGRNVLDKPETKIQQIAGYAVTDKSLPAEGRATYKGKYFLGYDEMREADTDHTVLGNSPLFVQKDQLSPYLTDFTYEIDFKAKSGQGFLRGAYGNSYSYDIKLEKGTLKKLERDTYGIDTYGVSSNLSTRGQTISDSIALTGKYTLGLFGPNAEEVAGKAVIHMNRDKKTFRTEFDRHVATNKDGDIEIGFGGIRGEIEK